MAGNQDRPYPVFVVVRDVDSTGVLSCLDLKRALLSCIMAKDSGGVERECLAWFTSEASVAEFMRRNGVRGAAIPIAGAEEAAEFLERHQFWGVAIDPVDPREKNPDIALRGDLIGYLLGRR